ncbi:DnaD domain-containing protein [Oribacterium sp. oral taxon 108]|uniref:DnaD domain-containing protein n=1 Tax=Oribacterium sp. oral taxon 108 TaxID=712414 RepID=UPI00020DDA57|nr:DnaD domain protein [Oribacterium sp. oral taxon 108]EGL37524.1 DnaD domain protein [Oribacterium sp. oral taxon 108 str. F0425]
MTTGEDGERAEMEIQFQEGIKAEITCVPNAFIDEYLGEASGEYVRVYLYLLRHLRENLKIHSIADALNLTDYDIKRAILYWEKRGIFKEGTAKAVEEEIRSEEAARLSEEVLHRKQANNFTKLSFFAEKNQKHLPLAEKNLPLAEQNVSYTQRNLLPIEEKKQEINEEEFEGILYVAQYLLPGGVSRSHIQKFEYMVEYLGMSSELIEFLLDYCASIDKTSPRYIESVALDWHEKRIQTVKQAKNLIEQFDLTKKSRKQNARQDAGKPEEKKNRFVNFKQDEVDYDSLAKEKALQLLRQGGSTEWH